MPTNRTPPDIFVTGRPSHSDYRLLTPRTPHSRAGRAEEGFTDFELQAYQDDESNGWKEQQQQQSQPLLSPGYRSRGDGDAAAKGTETRSVHYWIQLALSKLPLVGGVFLAFMLLAFIVVALTSPGKLDSTFLAPPGEFMETIDGDLVASTFKEPSPFSSASGTAPVPTASTPSHSEPHVQLISYENYTQFPLTGNQYRAECNKLMGGFMSHGEYWQSLHGEMDVEHHDDNTNYHLPEGGFTKVCSKTITYLLDGHVGLVADLALMAQAAAMARERNRTFLIDDTHWNRGKWTDYFQPVRGLDPGPEPFCRAPPPEELVACPRTARHWVISSRTAMYHFGHEFFEGYEDPYSHHLNRLKPIFERARISFEEAIRPNAHTAELIRAARTELLSTLSSPPTSPNLGSTNEPANQTAAMRGRDPAPRSDDTSHPPHNNPAPYVGVHIRRGDRRPAAFFFYPGQTIPLEKYVTATRQVWDRFYGNASSSATTSAGVSPADIGDAHETDLSSAQEDKYPAPPVTWLASDSPSAVREFTGNFSAATAIFSLNTSTNAELRALAPTREYVQGGFELEPEEERVRLTRGMVVDLAMVSGLWAYPGEVVPGAVVCAEGSNVCRVSALGFGFERAFGFDDGDDHHDGNPNKVRARWVDVDVEARIVPAWHAFELH
ncbi:hypothetical protein BD310DRAFT_918640 [Dichomitus squalens]|uniref:Uncharacterized protein n=1 Tax=Dichomitus squalens TaxID=114155 RepID=A0A4Q9Q590_9APHY|nr:hypothetical protein BD310DRAFT_918640 [Dichomitus squalens]